MLAKIQDKEAKVKSSHFIRWILHESVHRNGCAEMLFSELMIVVDNLL